MGSLLMSEKNDIRFLMRSGDFEQAYKKLFRCFNKQYKEVEDNWFVLYNLSYTCKQLKMEIESKYYISLAKDYIFSIEDYKNQKYWTFWLYIEINKKSMSETELIKEYNKLIDKFNLPNDSEMIIGLKNSIDVINKNFENIKTNFKLCLDRHYIDIINSILRETKDINLELYNELENLFEEYKFKNIINL